MVSYTKGRVDMVFVYDPSFCLKVKVHNIDSEANVYKEKIPSERQTPPFPCDGKDGVCLTVLILHKRSD